VECSNT